MRRLLIALALFAPATARADTKPISDEAMILKNLDAHVGAVRHEKAFAATVDEKGTVIGLDGQTASHWGIDWGFSGTFGALVVDKGATVVVTDAKKGYGWFHATVSGTFGRPMPDAVDVKPITLRLSGIATRASGTWKIAAVQWSAVLPDTELFARAAKRGAKLATGKPTITGNPAVGALVATWFAGGGLAKDQASASFANGTAPGELGANAKATNLAKAWDTLKMTASEITVAEIGGGALYFATVQVTLPQKTNAAPMSLAAVLVPDGKTYKWVSLNFTTALHEY